MLFAFCENFDSSSNHFRIFLVDHERTQSWLPASFFQRLAPNVFKYLVLNGLDSPCQRLESQMQK